MVIAAPAPRRVCLAVGVRQVVPTEELHLAELPGAVNGARAVARWAKAMGFVTRTVIDRAPGQVKSRAVTVAKIEKALTSLLELPTDWVLIYFAGHGASFAGADVWYLSDSTVKRRVVNFNKLVMALNYFGIRRLTIVADACRQEAPGDISTWSEDAVLPRGPSPVRRPRNDIFRATYAFNEAFMLPGDKPANARCIFTGLLEEALWGQHPEAFAAPPRDSAEIISASLVGYLTDSVPTLAATYGLT